MSNPAYPRWTPAELALVESSYCKLGPSGLVPLLPGRTWRAIKRMACELGVATRQRRWTREEDDILRQHVARLGAKRVARMLEGRDAGAVHDRCALLGIHIRRRWTAEEDARLQSSYGRAKMRELRAALGRSSSTIYLRAHRLGLPVRSNGHARPAHA